MKPTASSKAKQMKSFSQNVSKKIEGLKTLSIETYDHANGGRPSLIDTSNQRVWEGNERDEPT